MARKMNKYTEEFKQQMVQLYVNGKSATELSRDYDVGKSTLLKWVQQYRNSGSFNAEDNRSVAEKKLIQLEKENRILRMENDILKQAALIMGRKSN